MLEYFQKKLELLLDSVLGPLWLRIMAAPVGVKILILLSAGGIMFAISQPDLARHAYSRSVDIVRVATADAGTMPLSHGLVTRTRATAVRLSTTIAGDLLNLSHGYMTPWSTAQAAAATGGIDVSGLDKPTITDFIRTHVAPNCNCWTELPAEKSADHCVFISGWVMAAFADLGVPVSAGELQYALKTQHDDGSWPTFDVHNDDEYSSTYSTAWLLIGLVRQEAKGYIDGGDSPGVKRAITKAAGWLLSHRIGARWKPYPNLTSSTASESISGLALHALHLAVPSEAEALDAEWLNALPDRSLGAMDGENYYVEMNTNGLQSIDHFVQLKLPWMLIATVDAYPHGRVSARAKALYWVEMTLKDDSVHNADADANNWWRAELLYSLAYLLRDQPPATPEPHAAS